MLGLEFCHAACTGAGGRLICGHADPGDGRQTVDGCEGHDHLDRRAVGVADDVARTVESIGSVDLRNDEWHVAVHTESRAVVDHHGAVARDHLGKLLRSPGSG